MASITSLQDKKLSKQKVDLQANAHGRPTSTEPLPAGAGRISDVLFQVLKMGWLPPSPDGIAMCQDGGL
ncbi:hypothetical protein ROG8370_03759 [Roseovarius gaetbuli]|uniref:Uncharacterized protein n=1 Tax=Roseovarius gaetbuli TaxID=1356575 RepID=A0A1X7ACF1_9RHOB|nr:hypothetical protein [Roseovarius gaetbuli]SLN75222.1 hypothetical protein ROG8370_03759 [Roseovarius gaetbuli]